MQKLPSFVKKMPCGACDDLHVVEGGELYCYNDEVDSNITEADLENYRETGRCPCDRCLSNLEFAEAATQHLDGEERDRAMMQLCAR